jgi:hypothetical protein
MIKKILLFLIPLAYLSCAEDRAKSFLNHLPKMEEISFYVPGKSSENSLINYISHYTITEYNSLTGDVFIAIQLAEKSSPLDEEGDKIVWGPISWSGYLYRLWVEKKYGVYSFIIDMAFSDIPKPTFYVIAEGEADGEFSFTIDLKNLHNLDSAKYPDGETLFVQFHPDGVTGFAKTFSYLYPSKGDENAGYIDGTFYFLSLKKEEKKCVSFTRYWDYKKEIPYLLEKVYIEACWTIDGVGEGRAVFSEGELEKEEEVLECWDKEGNLIYKRTDGEEQGNEKECPFRGSF